MKYRPINQLFTGSALRWAASGWVPGRWFVQGLPQKPNLSVKHGRLKLEIVSHCWNYSHLLVYQLSSLVLHRPEEIDVQMTVYGNREDQKTEALVDYFATQNIPGVEWAFRHLPKEQLFRRAIGRNDAALKTSADWIWFTDCDLLFGEGCLDGLNTALQGLQEPLVFPKQEWCTGLLSDDAPLLNAGRGEPQILAVDRELFKPLDRSRATGPLQITHGDVARACGYCRDLAHYQQPAAKWCKAYEDRAFRWLLGSQGLPIEVPEVYRIRHASKGRYTRGRLEGRLRGQLRKFALKFKERS